MLTIENKTLKCTDEAVTSADSVLKLKADIDCKYIGVLTLSNGEANILEFIKIDDTYQARLIITSDNIAYLKNSTFKVIMISGAMSEETNDVKLTFSTELIKKDIRVSASTEIEELSKKLASVEDTVSSLRSSRVLDTLKISNLGYIKPGMIPVAVDDKGNFVAEYPFAQHVTTVNGQTAVNGVVIIDSSMIQYTQDMSIEAALKAYADAIVKLNDLVQTLTDNIKEIRTKLDETTIKLESHITNGVI